MSSKSGGPLRLTYDPTADSGAGAIVAGSAQTLGGLNTVGFFADAGGNFKNSLGPARARVTRRHGKPATAGPRRCMALYLAFERSKKIERINNVDQPAAPQSIETISKTTDKRKGVRFGIGMFHNADGTDDLYIDELGGNGVSLLDRRRALRAVGGLRRPDGVNPPVNQAGGCAATIVGGITTNFPQGMAVAERRQRQRQVPLLQPTRRATATRRSCATTRPPGLQDVVSSTVAPYDSLLNPGQQVSTYTFVLGLAVNPHNGDLFIGDDPTFAILVNPPLAKGHLFTITAARRRRPGRLRRHRGGAVPAAGAAAERGRRPRSTPTA